MNFYLFRKKLFLKNKVYCYSVGNNFYKHLLWSFRQQKVYRHNRMCVVVICHLRKLKQIITSRQFIDRFALSAVVSPVYCHRSKNSKFAPRQIFYISQNHFCGFLFPLVRRHHKYAQGAESLPHHLLSSSPFLLQMLLIRPRRKTVSFFKIHLNKPGDRS